MTRRMTVIAAVMSLFTIQAKAAITISVEVGTGPVTDLTTFGGVGTTNGFAMSGAAIAALNQFLLNDGSQYQFTSLNGTSNFPGSKSPERGHLTVDGVLASVRSGIAGLTLSESESGFTEPPPYYLISSSSGAFTNQPADGGHTVSTSFNGDSTVTYSILSDGTALNTHTKTTPYQDIPLVIPYEISNKIVFDLASASTAPVTDAFSATGVVAPEPATWLMMGLGFVGLAFLGWHRQGVKLCQER